MVRAAGPRIGLNLLYLAPGATGGTEVYARAVVPELVRAWPEARFVVFCGRELGDELAARPWAPGLEVVRLPISSRTRVRRVLGEQTVLAGAVLRARLDLLHSLATTTPLAPGPPQVVTINDLIYKQVPEAHAGLLGRGLAVLTPLSARRARRVLAISHATGEALEEQLGVARERIDVVPLAADGQVGEATPEAELRARLKLGDRPVLLSLSAKRPHKNLVRLIDAMAGVQDDAVLVLPGYPTAHEEELRAHAVERGVAGNVRFCGWIPDADVEGLYRLARGLVFPSLAEGFGLPVLEAMRRGVPVACSADGALAEVAGDAALLFDPRDTAAIADAVRRIVGDEELRRDLAARGPERAAAFSWARTAQGHVEAYRRALDAR